MTINSLKRPQPEKVTQHNKEQPLALEYKPFPEKLSDQRRFTISVQPSEKFKFPEAGRD